MNWKFPKYQVYKPIDWDEIEASYDWFKDMKGIPQDEVWHSKGDVFTHTKMVVEALIALPEFKALSEQDKHILFASALLHDVEKRSTTTTEEIDGKIRIVSPRHAKRGEFTTSKNTVCRYPYFLSHKRTNCQIGSASWIAVMGHS